MFIQKHLDMFKSTVDKYFELPEEQRWAGGYATVSLSDYLQKKMSEFRKSGYLAFTQHDKIQQGATN